MGVSYFGFGGEIMLTVCVALAIAATARGDNHNHNNVPPTLAPFFDDLCKEVECGKGRCETAIGSPFNFKCTCDSGWNRTRLHHDQDEDLQFLPCIIPDCEVDYSCMPAAPPLPPTPHNTSLFDPCYWVYCGEGTCVKNATRSHTCECNSGYSNLLNVSAFPCYSDCAIGSNSCERLGLKSATSTSNPSPNGNGNRNIGDSSQAIALITLPLRKFNWIPILLATAALAFSKYY